MAIFAHLDRHALAVAPIVRTLVATADRVRVEIDFAGSHVGEFARIGPTGTAVRIPSAAAFDLAAGAITAIRVYLPLDLLVRQIWDGTPHGGACAPGAGLELSNGE